VMDVAGDCVQVGPHHAPELCQGDRRLSVKQRSAKIPLQRADGGGQRGLRDAAAAGCAGEAELFAQRQEVTDLVHLHWFIASHSLSSASATHPDSGEVEEAFSALISTREGARARTALPTTNRTRATHVSGRFRLQPFARTLRSRYR